MGVLLSELLIPGWADGEKMSMTVFAAGDLPCHNVEPETFFSESKPDIQYAKALCGECPMRAKCLQGAIERQEPCGVWGGELFDDGKVIFEKRSPGRPRLNREVQEPVVAFPTRANFSPSITSEERESLEMVG
jgi:WhiB family redox-sensing transcriptional regulator